MALRKITVNNMSMDNQRKTPMYQAIIIDLCNAGVIDPKVAEGLLGEKVPEYIRLPNHFNKVINAPEEDDDDEDDTVSALKKL